MEWLTGAWLLDDPEFAETIAPSVWEPTPERLAERMKQYRANPQVRAFACRENGVLLGAAVVRHSGDRAELLDIAVQEKSRGSGVGRGIIHSICNALTPRLLLAETDGDAVGFYRALGFQISNAGQPWGGGVTRYRCVLRNGPPGAPGKA